MNETINAETKKTERATIYKSAPTEIVVRTDRHRQSIKKKPLDNLITSIREAGQIQPGVCITNNEGDIELLVGERRLKACMVLEREFEYYLKEEITDPLLLEQIQLDENLCRENLTWQEEVKAKQRIHQLLQEIHGEAKIGMPGGHGISDTAEHIGVKPTILHEDVTLAPFLAIPEVAAAKNKTTAKKIVKRLIGQVKRKEKLQEALKNVKKLPDDTAPLTEEARKEREKVRSDITIPDKASLVEKQLIRFSQRCILGSMEEEIAKFEDKSFDIIFFDPPWGVDFDKVRKESPGTIPYDDNEEAFIKELPNWLKLIFDKLKEDAHFYMFFAIRNYPFVYRTLNEIGFKTNGIPIIWYKRGAHVTRNPLVWPGRSYEPIVFARKGSKPLQQLGSPDVIITAMPTPSIKGIHPSAKHPDIYKELLRRSAKPGDNVLDPMAGSGMMAVAAEALAKTHAVNWYNIEIAEDYRDLQLYNLSQGYENIVNKSIEDTEQQAALIQEQEKHRTFKALEPGTPEWSQWWSEHPEDQDAMLEWRQKNKK